jgi:hypothetical protein
MEKSSQNREVTPEREHLSHILDFPVKAAKINV